MIAAVAKVLGVSEFLMRAIAIVLAALLLWWAATTVYDGIYDRGYAEATAVWDKERAVLAEADANEQRRQTIANNAAKRREAEAIAALAEQEAENEELRRRLASEAQQDPDAGRTALGPDSVRRINKIR